MSTRPTRRTRRIAAVAVGAVVLSLGSGPAFADSTTSSGTGGATVIVDSSIELVVNASDNSFTLQGGANATGVTATDNSIGYSVTTNNLAGYTVSEASTAANLVPADSTTNPDVIPFSAVTVAGESTGLGGALSTAGVTVFTQATRSLAAGDTHTSHFSANIPFVNAATYTGTVTLTATAQ